MGMTKAHILSEIRRTAVANGGVPLGEARLRSETGIKRFDWFGIYWARFGDALQEAGYLPNQLQGAYDETELLEKYARLAQELRRLPTSGDLRLKSRANPGFPSHSVFAMRLGNKVKLVELLLRHCRGRDGYEDVVRLCENYVAPKGEERDDSEAPEGEIGDVYLIKSGRFYKIGKSNAAGRREYELGVQLPERCKLIHVIRTDDPGGIEAYWHRRFEAKRKNGEWFELAAADLAAFKRRKFM